MKTRYYYLIFPLLLCLSQMLHAQDKPVKPIEPNEKLNAGASVTKQLVYHDAGENTANYYRFSTMEPLLFSFSFSDFSYSLRDSKRRKITAFKCTVADTYD